MTLRRLRAWNAGSPWWHWSYFVDWALALFLGVCCGVILLVTKPSCRDFDPADKTISHPFVQDETFPNWAVPVVSLILPWGVLAALVVWQWHGPDRRSRLHALALCLAQAVMLATLFTTATKQYAGRYRPDFLSRLELVLPKEKLHDYFNASTDVSHRQAMVSWVCEQKAKVLVDGRQSFPSGHSSFSFAAWTVVVLFLLSMHGAKLPHHPYGFAITILAFVPILVPTWIAVSRTIDYRHGFADVLAGSLIGIFCACVAYQRHFPFTSSNPHNRRVLPDEVEDDDIEDAASLASAPLTTSPRATGAGMGSPLLLSD